MYKQNLHTHTSYDHGKDTVEEMVQTALAKGFTTLGFSGHGTNRPLAPTSMSSSAQQAYKKAVLEAREKYKGQIEIFLGIEQDSMAPFEDDDLDYKIGSVHYLCHEDQVLPLDETPELFEYIRDTFYEGDIKKMIAGYYQTVENMMDTQNFDIVGHIDLISKFNEHEEYFPFDAGWYLDLAEHAVDKGIAKGLIFEMNTGAVARGNRETAYPSQGLLEYMAANGAKLCIDTDCHDRTYLDYQMDLCVQRAKQAGFKTLMHLTENGFVEEPIEAFDQEAQLVNVKPVAAARLHA